jgi:hypothetical protein
MEKLTTRTVIRVRFMHPVIEKGGRTDFFFGSMAAIYDVFTPEEIGCRLGTLYAANITPDRFKTTANCVISKHRMYTKKHKER